MATRASLLVYLIAGSLLSACAQEGVVVQKISRPAPFTESLGIDATYSFVLRDSQGQMHSQMVTAWVFQNYEEGDYFNDLQAPPTHRAGFDKDGKTMLPPTSTPQRNDSGVYLPPPLQPEPPRDIPRRSHPLSQTHQHRHAHKALAERAHRKSHRHHAVTIATR